MVDSVSPYSCEESRLHELARTKRTKVIQYDCGPLVVLKSTADFEAYISQNNDWEIQRWRQVRLSLRALDGQQVVWPYEHVTVSIHLRHIQPEISCSPPSAANRRSFKLVVAKKTL